MPRNDHFQDITATGNVSLGAQSKIEGNLIPDTDDTRTLGDATHRWDSIFLAGTLNATGFRADSITLDTTNADVVLSRASANKLQLASGDSFQLDEISAIGKLNNILFVDGVKYPTTIAGIQSAHDDLPSDGGMIVLKGGTTYSGSGLTISKPVWMRGAGRGGFTNSGLTTFAQATILQNTSTTVDLVTISPPAGADIGMSGIILEGMVLLGNRDVASATTGSNIAFASAAYPSKFIRNVIIRNLWSRRAIEHGMIIKSGANVFQLSLEGYEASYNTLDGFNIAGSVASSIFISGNSGFEFNRDGVRTESTALVNDVFMEHTTLVSNVNGLNMKTGAAYVFHNHFETNTTTGIRVSDSGFASVGFNTIVDGGAGTKGIHYVSGVALPGTPDIIGNTMSGAGTSILIDAGINSVRISPQALVGTITDSSGNAYRYDLIDAIGGNWKIPAGKVIGWSDASFNRVGANHISTNSSQLTVQNTLTTTGQFVSSIATGTAPFSIASTTNVANLNASSLSGATFAAPGAIGGGTPAAATFTTMDSTTARMGGLVLAQKRGSVVSASIGGSALLAGACASATVTITGVAVTDLILVTPNSAYPGDGSDWFGYRSAADTVTVKVCALVALTPAAATYNVLAVIP